MSRRAAVFLRLAVFVLAVASAVHAADIEYRISLQHAPRHQLLVAVGFGPGAAERQFQMPAWNALYQIRDFVQHVTYFSGKDANGSPLVVDKVDKNTWRVSGAQNGGVLTYAVYANRSGPYNAEANADHVFLNLAQVLVYDVAKRNSPVSVTFTELPEDWEVATVLSSAAGSATFTAPNYDVLVDSPVEIGEFERLDVQEGGGLYSIVVDGKPGNYRISDLVTSVRKIVRAGVEWMNDRPCDRYMFIFHIPEGRGGGGMEHACSTSIEVEAGRLKANPGALDGVTAHEFFHAWNVKRIRPAALQPLDYTKEQFTRSLWFSEGVTNTVENFLLVRAGMLDEKGFLNRLADEIRAVETRPARRSQSAEASSLEAWLEKYPEYLRPERSISYYSKGAILGAMLDLAMRDATQGRKCLQDVFRWMNEQYGRAGKPFPEGDGVRSAVEAVAGVPFAEFFRKYVSGTEEIPYDTYLGTVGLRLQRTKKVVLRPGFEAQRTFTREWVVTAVEPGSDAEQGGLHAGDVLMAVNGAPIQGTFRDAFRNARPGSEMLVQVRSRSGEKEVTVKLSSGEDEEFSILSVAQPTKAQLARRAAWLRGEPQEAAR